MRKVLTAAIVLPLGALLLLLAMANRSPVTLSLDPFTPETSIYSVQLPLFLVIVLAIMLGVIVGGITDWVRQAPYRREARHARLEVRQLEQEAADLRRASANSNSLPVPYSERAG